MTKSELRSYVALATLALLGVVVIVALVTPYFGYEIDSALVIGLAGVIAGVLTAILGAQFIANGGGS